MTAALEAARAQHRIAAPSTAELAVVLQAEETIAAMDEAAFAALQGEAEAAPGDPWLQLELGLVLARRGEHAAAIARFSAAINSGCSHWRVGWYIAQAARRLGNVALVDQACAAVLRVNPQFWFARELPKHARGFYAQTGQDEYLDRFFARVAPRTKRFVEVGGFDGVHYSNVRRLHETHGWSGLCIEPVGKNFRKLAASYAGTSVRCIQAGVSTRDGEMQINVSTYPHLPDWGSDVATFGEADKERWEREFGAVWTQETVSVRRLTGLLDEAGIDDFDVLSIDTEGHDLEVLRSLDLHRFRPQVIIIEYGEQKAQIASHLAANHYRVAQDNGLDLIAEALPMPSTAGGARPLEGAVPAKRTVPPDAGPELQSVLSRLNPHLVALNTLPVDRPVRVERVAPLQLLTPDRFDLAAKHLYALHRERGVKSEWAGRLYHEHIRAFSGGSCREGDGRKHSIEDYFREFHALLDNFKSSGFDAAQSLVPVGTGHVLIDGGHRAAAALLYERPVDVATFETTASRFDSAFFRDRGLSGSAADAMALHYCTLNPDTRLVVVFPSAVGRDQELRAILEAEGRIVHAKEIFLNRRGALHLIRELYIGEKWLGQWQNGFAGAAGKMEPCFQGSGPVRLFVFECGDLDRARRAKQAIRDLFQIENHSVHINDTREETLRLARALLNDNTIRFFNRCDLPRHAAFHRLRERYEALVKECAIDGEQSCLWGDAVRALHGQAEPDRLAFLHRGGSTPGGQTQLQDASADLTEEVRDDIIFNPARHFYCLGLRFATLDCLEAVEPIAAAARRNAFEFCRSEENVGLVIVWPAAFARKDDIVRSLSRIGRVRHEHPVRLTRSGATNLLAAIHDGKEWWRQHLGREVNKRFPAELEGTPATVLVFDYDDIDEIRRWKNAFRPTLGLEKSSFHVADPDCPDHLGVACTCRLTPRVLQREVLRHARMLLNPNSVHFLNHHRPGQSPGFEAFFARYRAALEAHQVDPEHCCITMGGALAAYGIRDSHDLDYVALPGVPTTLGDAECHNPHYAALQQACDLPYSIDQLVNDPSCHFYYRDLKVVALPIIQRVKETRFVEGRRREKDVRDGQLIEAFLADRPTASAAVPAGPPKIVALLAARNEAERLPFCLRALARYSDAIVYLDDCSDDASVAVVEALAAECRVGRIIRKPVWHRDEPGDNNRLLQAGRELGGTHFIKLDADEAFTANCARDDYLRRLILSLEPGDRLVLSWIQLWRSLQQYRFDRSQWTYASKAFAFADDGRCHYESGFIHTPRVPDNLRGRQVTSVNYVHGVLHFQFVDWSNLQVKQAWYRCMERVRQPQRPPADINRQYSPSEDESGLGLRPAPADWLEGYAALEHAAPAARDERRIREVLEWFRELGPEHFLSLDIWRVDWARWAEDAEFAAVLHEVQARAKSAPRVLAVAPASAEIPPAARQLMAAAGQHLNRGDLAACTDALQRALALAPEHPELQSAMGNLLFIRGDLPGAQKLLERSLIAAPDRPLVLTQLAAVYRKRNQLTGARRMLERALGQDPACAPALRLLAEIQVESKKPSEAIATCQRWIAAAGTEVAAHLLLGRAHAASGALQEAAAAYENALRLDPANAVARDNLATLRRKLGPVAAPQLASV